MLDKVIENWTSRLDYIRASRGRKKKKQKSSKEHNDALSYPNTHSSITVTYRKTPPSALKDTEHKQNAVGMEK
ncbi:hypothetical protein TNCV_4531951 [Trichonephila clavipes]|nr:hypothetical protein TNCV_4531951 [Trichonephila clavipes]